MARNRERADDARSTWESLAPWKQAQEWLASTPDIAVDLMAVAKSQLEHKRKLEIRYWWLQVASLIGSILVVVVLGIISWHAADHNLAVPTATAAGGGGLLAGGMLGLNGLASRRRRQESERRGRRTS